jgi:hypothetical protein
MNKWQWRVIVSVLFALSLVLVLSAGTAVAQKPVEICDNGIDDDGNKLVDCADPACAKDPACQKATGCSPGFYKNHTDFWDQCCDGEGQPTCAQLLTALTCKGADAICGRSAAALYLDGCTQCSE